MKRFMILGVATSVVLLAFLFIACGGGGGGGGDGVSPADFMAVCLRDAGQIAIVDLSDYSIAATYDVGVHPMSIDISPDKSTFYVTDNEGDEYGPGLLWVLNVADGAVISSIQVSDSTSGGLWGVKVHPDGSKVYVSDFYNDEIAVVDAASYAVTTTISVGDKPVGLAISKDGSKLCVPNKADDTVTIIDTATNFSITSTVLGGHGGGPWEVAFTPDGTECWVDDSDSSGDGEVLTVVSAADASIVAQTVLAFIGGDGAGLQGISFTPDGSNIFIGSVYSSDMFKMNTATLAYTSIDTQTPSGGYAKRMAMDPTGETLYYSTAETALNGDRIFIIDVSDFAVASTTIDFGNGDAPNGIVLY